VNFLIIKGGSFMGQFSKIKVCLLSFILFFFLVNTSLAAENKPIKMPDNVHSIAKENTVVNNENEIETIVATEDTKELLSGLKYQITNPLLIQQLNESSIKGSPFALGYRGMIFLGRWPVNYETKETTMNWEY